MLDQANATVLAVAASSSGEAFDGPLGPGAEKWAGTADAYLRVRRDRTNSPAGGDRVVDRRLVVASSDPPVDWASGDWVTFTFDGDQETVRVELVEPYKIGDPDIPPEVQTTRLTLEAG